VATFVFMPNQACKGLLVLADRRMRTIAPPTMIASQSAKFHGSIDKIGWCRSRARNMERTAEAKNKAGANFRLRRFGTSS